MFTKEPLKMIMLKKILTRIVMFVVLAGLGAGFVIFYSYIFSKHITGEIIAVEKVNIPLAILNPNNLTNANQAFSFAVAIKESGSQEIYTASSEDRQWAAVTKGYCAEIKIFPYPPWNIEKSGTFYGARLLKLFECKK